MKTGVVVWCIGVALMAGTAIAQVQEGRYFSGNPALCAGEWVGDGAVEISQGRLRFIEGLCDLTNPTAVRGMAGAILYDGQCAAEGSRFESRIMLMQTRDGNLSVTWPGAVEIYLPCR